MIRHPGRVAVLRGLALRTLEVGTMALGPSVPVPGDVAAVELRFDVSGSPVLTVKTDQGTSLLRPSGNRLEPAAAPAFHRSSRAVRLSGGGVGVAAARSGSSTCAFEARDVRNDKTPAVRIQVPGGDSFLLGGRYGAGLDGLPFLAARDLALPAPPADQKTDHSQ